MKSGWRTGERWSTPSGRSRCRAISSDTLAPSSTPPVPGLAPWPTTISTRRRHRHVVGVDAVAARQHLVDQACRRFALLRAHAAVAGRGRDARAVRRRCRVRPSACRDSAPYDMPAIVIGIDPGTSGIARRSGCPRPSSSHTSPGSPPAEPGTACTGTNVRSSNPGTRRCIEIPAVRYRPSCGLQLDVLDDDAAARRGTRVGRERPARCLDPSSDPPHSADVHSSGSFGRKSPELSTRAGSS